MALRIIWCLAGERAGSCHLSCDAAGGGSRITEDSQRQPGMFRELREHHSQETTYDSTEEC